MFYSHTVTALLGGPSLGDRWLSHTWLNETDRPSHSLVSTLCVDPFCAGYRFVEFDNEIEIRRSDTGMNEAVCAGCLTAGLIGKIAKFDNTLILAATNEPSVL